MAETALPYPLQGEGIVLDAVRAFLRSLRSGNGVAEAMDSLVAETSGLPLTRLDDWESVIRAELWADSRPAEARCDRRSPLGRPLTWLDICSADGYTRERTLRCISAAAPNGFFCALAMRRLNDWVPQVRQAARECLPPIAARSEPDHVVDGLWSILPHAFSWGRTENAERLIFDSLMSMEPVADALRMRITRATVGPATLVLSQAGRTSALDCWLPQIASGAIQPSVRARAYRSLLEGRMVWVVGRRWVWTDLKWCKGRFEPVMGERSISVGALFLDVLKSALGDRSPMVRRVAAELLIKNLDSVGVESLPMAKDLASDRAPYVAERGRFALDRLSREGAR